jgi:hypothetical protein
MFVLYLQVRGWPIREEIWAEGAILNEPFWLEEPSH